MHNETPGTTKKDDSKKAYGFIVNNLQPILLTICLSILITIITLAVSASGPNDQSVNATEINVNSEEWNMLQDEIDMQLLSIDEARKRQIYLEKRNELLRALFMEGKN